MTVSEDYSPITEGVGAPSVVRPSRFMARQPILNVRREVVGFELLFRSGWENAFRGESDDATRQMLDNCVTTGIESLVDGGLAFVNCTREALLGRLVALLPPQTTVLEVLETVEPDAEVIGACLDLHRMGYRIALDDFLPGPEMQPLIEIASYVKVDFRLCDAAARRNIWRLTRNSHAALLAEKIEDEDEFHVARKEGYEYFQGYFFCRPKVVANREIPPNRMNYLRLLIELSRSTLDVREVTRIAQLEASLSYRLLRLANSPLWGIQTEVTSLREALMLVGEARFRMLVSVAASSVLGQNQPSALIRLSLERARFCELLASRIGDNSMEQFMLGLLSLVDVMLAMPMQTVADSLPLRKEAKAALLGARNQTSIPLCLIRSFETGEWGNCAAAAQQLGIGEETLTTLYLEAVAWARESQLSTNR